MVERHFTTGCKIRGSPSALNTAKADFVVFLSKYIKMRIKFKFAIEIYFEGCYNDDTKIIKTR